MRIVAGTYEGVVFGWETPDGRSKNDDQEGPAPVILKTNEEQEQEEANELDLQLVYRYTPQRECIKALGFMQNSAGSIMISGGTSETMRIFNVRTKVEVGVLMEHTKAITALEFHRSSHLLSGSEDNNICIWRTSDWTCIHILGGHKGPVNSIAIHPSGKLALSTSRDRTLRMWNLVKGRCAYIKKLPQEASQVVWSSDGMKYALACGRAVSVYEATTNEVTTTLHHKARVNAVVFLPGGLNGAGAIATGGEDKTVRCWNCENGSLNCELNTGFTARVRSLAVTAEKDNAGELTPYLVVASGNGMVQVWDSVGALSGDEAARNKPLWAVLAGGDLRMTTLAVAPTYTTQLALKADAAISAQKKAEKKDMKRKKKDAKAQDQPKKAKRQEEEEAEAEEEEEEAATPKRKNKGDAKKASSKKKKVLKKKK
jgi:protein MAK11